MTSHAMGLWLCGAFCGGLMSLGYFGGLRLTVNRLPRSPHPTRLYLVSFALRAALVSGGFLALLTQFDAQVFAAALAGFLTLRLPLVRWLAGPAPRGAAETHEVVTWEGKV